MCRFIVFFIECTFRLLYISIVTVGVVSFLGFLGGMLVFPFFAECKILSGDFFCGVRSTISIIVIFELFWEGI